MRAFNRILCTLLAVAIAAAGVLTVIEVIAAATGSDPVVVKWRGLTDDLTSTQWKDVGPRIAAAVLIVVGLLLLLFALRRGKPATVGLTTNASDVDLTTTRRSLQRSLSATATGVDGISDAAVKVKRRKVLVKARAGSGVERDDARSRLTSTMQDRVDGLALADARKLKVKVAAAPEKRQPDAPGGLGDAGPLSSGNTGDDARTPVGAGAGATSAAGGSSSGASGTGTSPQQPGGSA